MKKLAVRILVLSFLTVIMFVSLCLLSTRPRIGDIISQAADSAGYAGWGSGEVNSCLSIVREENQKNQLVIGDSVANQLFGNTLSDNYCVATSNQAMTMAGEYILVEEYLAAHPQATDVYLAVIAGTFGVDINTTWGYQYLAMPHTQAGTISLLDGNTIREMEDKYGRLFMKKWMIGLIEPSGLNRKLYLNALKKVKGEDETQLLSPLFVQYFCKIEELCAGRGVSFHVVACPLKDTGENHELMEELEKECGAAGLLPSLGGYFEQADYYPEELFKDEIHFRDDYMTLDNRIRVIGKMSERQALKFDYKNNI